MKINGRSEILKNTIRDTETGMDTKPLISRQSTTAFTRDSTRGFTRRNVNNYVGRPPLSHEKNYGEMFPTLNNDTDTDTDNASTCDISSNNYKNAAQVNDMTENTNSKEDCPIGWTVIYYNEGKYISEYNESSMHKQEEKIQQQNENAERYYEVMQLYEEQEKRRLEYSEYAYDMGVIDHVVTREELYEQFICDDVIDYENEFDIEEFGDSSGYLDDEMYEEYDDNKSYKYS